MTEFEKGANDDFSEIWRSYLAFEKFSRSRGESLDVFLSQWKEKMLRAQSAGCQYSDNLLACKLLDKANLRKEDIDNICTSTISAKLGAFSMLLSRVETYDLVESDGEELHQMLHVFDKSEEVDLIDIKQEIPNNRTFPPCNNQISEERFPKHFENRNNAEKGDSSLISLSSQHEILSDSEVKGEPVDDTQSYLVFPISDLVEHLPKAENHESQIRRKKVCPEGDKFKAFKCDICGKIFDRPWRLTLHLTKKHVPEVSPEKMKVHSQCPICGKSFLRKRLMKQHYKKCVSQVEDFNSTQTSLVRGRKRKSTTCEVCGKTFARPFNLSNHMPLHTGERNFKCDFCPATFSHYGNLYNHRFRHTGDRSHKCDQCPKAFFCSTDLKVHIKRVHSSDHQYQCDHCGYRTVSKYRLNRHIMSHTGERPFKCTLCEKTYKDSKSLKRHAMTHHTEGAMERAVVDKELNGYSSAQMQIKAQGC